MTHQSCQLLPQFLGSQNCSRHLITCRACKMAVPFPQDFRFWVKPPKLASLSSFQVDLGTTLRTTIPAGSLANHQGLLTWLQWLGWSDPISV